MKTPANSYFIGSGIGSLAAAAFMIRDGKVPGANISILESAPLLGGSLDGAGDGVSGYSLRGGRMLTTDNYECTWDLYKTIPSLSRPGKTVFDETVEFNEIHKAHSLARLVDRRRAKVPVVANKATDAIREVKIGNKAVMTTIEESRPSGVKPLIALTRASGSGRSRGGLRETSIKRTSKGAGWRKRFPTGRNGRR